MNLLINLFSDSRMTKKSERRFSLIKGYDFSMSSGISKDLVMSGAYNLRDEIYASTIKYGLSNERSYSYFLGAVIDTHFNLEAMNVSKRSKGYVVVYSVSKMLPLVFNLLCNSDIEKVSMIEGIDDISESILNLDFTKDLFVNSLLNVDDNLNEYLKTFFYADSGVDELKRFVTQINLMALNVIKYLISCLESNSNLVVLSVDKSRILLSCSSEEAPVLDVVFKDFRYRLNPLVTDELNGFYVSSKDFNFCEVVA